MDDAVNNGTSSSAAAARVSPGPSSNADTKRKATDAVPAPAQGTAEGSMPTKRAKSGDGQQIATVTNRSQSSDVAASQGDDATGSNAMPDAPTSGTPQDWVETARAPPAAAAGASEIPGASQGPVIHPRLSEGASAAPASAQVVTQAQLNASPSNDAAPKSSDAIQKEVRELLEDKLMGKGEEAVKVAAFRTLAGYVQVNENGVNDPIYQQTSAYRRAVSKWHGCHLVLVVLRQELAKVDGPSRDVVFGAVQFLTWWNRKATRRVSMALFSGGETILSAMQAYENDKEIPSWALACLLHFTVEDDAKRRKELVQGNAIFHVFRALTHANATRPSDAVTAVRLLGRLRDSASARHLEGLVEIGALEALVDVYKAHKSSDDGLEIGALCLQWMAKLLV